ncbi:MAG: hypothetical protein ACM30G_04110 [Micromonosporaceae bacterium]
MPTLRADISIPVALGTAGVVWGIYQLGLPSLADARAVEPNSADLAAAERQALVMSAAVAGGIALLAGDPTPFVVGGLLAVGLSWLHRHSNMLNSTTQTIWNRDSFGGRRYVVEAEG